MESTKKRSKQSNISPAVNGNNAPGTGNQASTGKTVTTIDSLPLEMLQHILHFGSNTNTLKSWRFVSKSWNDVCCRILQKVSAVPLNVGEDDEGEVLEKFKDLIIDQHYNFPSDWPNPFQNFKILEASLVNKNLARFVERPNIKITTLEILHDERFDPVVFGSILKQIKGELIHLKIRSKADSAPFLTPLSLTEGQSEGDWSSLKTLDLKDTCKAPLKSCPHVEFLSALKTSVSIEALNLDGELVNITRLFAEKDQCWDQLIRLELQCQSPPLNVTPEQIYQFMKWTQEINFRPLTHLAVWFNNIDQDTDVTSKRYIPYFLPFIQRSSQVIEDLRVNFMPLSLLPRLPKLEYLSCAVLNSDRIPDMTESKFPSLTAVYIHLHCTEVPIYVEPKDAESNKNVLSLKVYWRSSVSTAVKQELVWSILSDHFPNLNTIGIQRYVPSSTLYVIRRRFPGLSSIHLRAITPTELLGTSSVPVFTAKGWPCQAYENCALLEMTELTHVTLGEFVTVSTDIITACLGKLSKIRSLCFHWNSLLQTSDVSNHIGHIQDVTIFYKNKQQKQELEVLTKTMKSLKLVKHQS